MRLVRLHHVAYGVTDLDAMDRFTADFGLQTVSRTADRLVKRTAGGDAYCCIIERAAVAEFRGFALLAEGMEDLQEAVDQHGGSPIRALTDAGGGHAVTLHDPDGIRIDIVTGVGDVAPRATAPGLVPNSPPQRQRFNAPQSRRELGPAHLFRLGHIGLSVSDYPRTMAWYQKVIGLIPSDTLTLGANGPQVGAFARLDRGDTFTDHHTIALFQVGKPGYHHASFEVQDYQAQFMAHRWLESRGWELNWGVGRHPLGSHVFDMWFAPDRFRFETYSDTDLMNASGPRDFSDVMGAHMDLWSPDPPDRYFA